MKKLKAFLKRKNIVLSLQRYGIDAMRAMAQGLFCTLLVGTILNTLGQQLNIGFLNAPVVSIRQGDQLLSYTIGGLASLMVGPGIAISIGFALGCPPLVLFSLIPVGFTASGPPAPPMALAAPAARWRCMSSPLSPRNAASWSPKRPKSTFW